MVAPDNTAITPTITATTRVAVNLYLSKGGFVSVVMYALMKKVPP